MIHSSNNQKKDKREKHLFNTFNEYITLYHSRQDSESLAKYLNKFVLFLMSYHILTYANISNIFKRQTKILRRITYDICSVFKSEISKRQVFKANLPEINTILTYFAFIHPNEITGLFSYFVPQIEDKEQICQRFNSEIEVIKMKVLNYKNDLISTEILDVDKIISSIDNNIGGNDEIQNFDDNSIGNDDEIQNFDDNSISDDDYFFL